MSYGVVVGHLRWRQTLKNQIIKWLRRPAASGTPYPFSTSAKQAARKAIEAAQSHGHAWIGSEHLLIGIAGVLDEEGESGITPALQKQILEARRRLQEWFAFLDLPRSGDSQVEFSAALKSRLSRAIQLAASEREEVSIEHLIRSLSEKRESMFKVLLNVD